MTTETKLRKGRLSDADQKALVQLADLCKSAGSEWVTEQQWRAWADRRSLQVAGGEDGRARGFLINDLIEAGKVVASNAVFHAPRPGAPDPVAISIYRLA